jgi:nitroreductase
MEDGSIKFLTNQFCIKCGHCISVCSEDAILYESTDKAIWFPEGKDSHSFVQYEHLLDLFKSKRSVRNYTKEIVEMDKIEKILEAIRYSPSGGNNRQWKFALISDPEKIERLSNKIVEKVSSANPRYGIGFKVKKKIGIEPVFFGAPQLLILYYPPMFPYLGYNTAIALTYGMLAAETLGIGTCWIGMAQRVLTDDEELRKYLGIDGNVAGVITLGYPKVKYFKFPPRGPLKVLGLKK